MGFPGDSDSKKSASNVGDSRRTRLSGTQRSPGEGNGYPCQCSCLENPVDRGAWQAAVPAVTESDTTESIYLDSLHFFKLNKVDV